MTPARSRHWNQCVWNIVFSSTLINIFKELYLVANHKGLGLCKVKEDAVGHSLCQQTKTYMCHHVTLTHLPVLDIQMLLHSIVRQWHQFQFFSPNLPLLKCQRLKSMQEKKTQMQHQTFSSNPHMHQVALNHVQSNQELNLQNAISISQTVGFTSG
jgi:hypothetical protein